MVIQVPLFRDFVDLILLVKMKGILRQMRLLLVLLFVGSALTARLNDPCDISADPDPCEFNTECVPSEENPANGVCKCKPRYSPESSSIGCVAALDALSATCRKDAEDADFGAACNAIPFALCEPATGPVACTCLRGYKPSQDGTVCLLNSFMERCLENAQCADFDEKATCQAERCVCPAGYVQDTKNMKCKKSNGLGESCEIDEQCPENANCKSAKCECKEKYFLESGTVVKKCLPKVYKVGDRCEAAVQCNDLNLDGETLATCDGQNICACPADYVASNDGTKCLLKVAGDDPNGLCIQDVQCLDGYYCEYPNCAAIETP
ncbi:cell death abnormality protein 1-like [Cloeon dipterum]|uniref:cell death abnormality protein 1-like n=1 Tax=Cloeon dipterum TaxID=197152 RepID=UPI003220784A